MLKNMNTVFGLIFRKTFFVMNMLRRKCVLLFHIIMNMKSYTQSKISKVVVNKVKM